MENPKIYENGNKSWYNEEGELHREGDPAVEYINGDKYWYENDKCHRLDGPAIEKENGDKEWYQNGKCHREDGPAIERINGYKFWYQNDKRHRLDGPAIEINENKYWYIEGEEYTEEEFNKKITEMKVQNPEIDEEGNKRWYNENGEYHRIDGPAEDDANGDKFWYQNGKLHREDGPAIEWANGDKYWYQNGKGHRLDGPAIEYANGDKEWWVNGKRHRLDGPAIEWANGEKNWWIEDTEYTEADFNKKIGKSEKKVEPKMKDIIKDRLEKAAYRSASRQMVQGLSKVIVKVAEQKGMDSFTAQAVGKFFETELGEALIGAMLGVGIPYIPKINKNQRALKLAEEFQIESISTITDTILSEVFTYVLPVVSEALNTLPSRVEIENEEELVEDTITKKEISAGQRKLSDRKPLPLGSGSSQRLIL